MRSNADRSDTGRTHWWSILDLHSKTEVFLFDSFGLKVLYDARLL